MYDNPRDAYLDTQVRAASPVKLRLLLVEGAIRFLLLAKESQPENHPRALEMLGKAREILAEILSGVLKVQTELGVEQKKLYGFLLRQVGLMQLRSDFAQMEGVLKVLEEERETWRQVLESHPELGLQEKKESPIGAPHSVLSSLLTSNAVSLEA